MPTPDQEREAAPGSISVDFRFPTIRRTGTARRAGRHVRDHRDQRAQPGGHDDHPDSDRDRSQPRAPPGLTDRPSRPGQGRGNGRGAVPVGRDVAADLGAEDLGALGHAIHPERQPVRAPDPGPRTPIRTTFASRRTPPHPGCGRPAHTPMTPAPHGGGCDEESRSQATRSSTMWTAKTIPIRPQTAPIAVPHADAVRTRRASTWCPAARRARHPPSPGVSTLNSEAEADG